MTCIFCGIVEGDVAHHRVWEDSNFVAFLDLNPIKAGHLLIVPRTHIDYVFDLPRSLYDGLFAAARLLSAL
jgi:histidine triad (HIT) family protein